jgi:uncharacterized membrane protein
MIPAAMEAAMSVPAYETERSIIADDKLALAVYVLYGLGYFTGITPLIGVIIAHVKVDDAEEVLHSHYRFQIRTFWIGLAYLATGLVLSVMLIGLPILLWWFVWSLIRIIKGGLLLVEHKPILNPGSWLFG